ncbi:MAG: DUF4290 domain-containing protein [Crocinitomix sp.]|nr:DUF4290 domain-containing protein [Crocinitomix sp.]
MSEIDSLEYNTARSKMLIPEYGRNVQKMVDHAVSLEDREKRNKVAQAIIKVMGELKPELRDVEEYKPKLWTHLFIMSDFELDVDSPYPMPNREVLAEKPNKVAYPQTRIKIGHYGKNVEILIAKAVEMEDEEEREALVKTIACMMKQFYLTFNSTSIEDDMIIDHLAKLSEGKIQLTDVSFLPSTGSILKANGLTKNSNSSNKNSNNKSRNNKNRNKNNRKRH